MTTEADQFLGEKISVWVEVKSIAVEAGYSSVEEFLPAFRDHLLAIMEAKGEAMIAQSKLERIAKILERRKKA